MTQEESDTPGTRLEREALRHPSGYRLRVLLLALLGNAYLAAMLLLVIGLFVALLASIALLKGFAVKLSLVVGFFLWLVLKALWVRVPSPAGNEVTASEAPELFAMIAELRRQLGAPAFHHVLVTDDFNAGVVQAPRLGLFGWSRNYLMLGLPLMKTLGVEQFKAVLAHEFGHLAKGHGRMSNWIYRQRLRWERLAEALEANCSKGSVLFKPFLNWYAPCFNAYSFPLARANEYDADATAARLTSPQAAAEALTGINVAGDYLNERYWPQIHRRADEFPQPGFAPYFSMGKDIAAALEGASAQAWLARALARKTASGDTHPALADRLLAIGEGPRLAPPAPGMAADRLLGNALSALTEAFDLRWHDDILPSWQIRHLEVQEGRRRLAELDALHRNDAMLSWQDAYERAGLTESVGGGREAALEQFRALYDREPDTACVCHALGARLLGRDDSSGSALVERAMQLDPDFILDGSRLLRDYCWRHGREDEARGWNQRMIERTQLQQCTEQERSEVRLKDTFERHALPAPTVAALIAQLRSVAGLRKVYFLKKRTQYLRELPCYVLGFTVRGMFLAGGRRRAAEVQQRLLESVRLPEETIVLSVEGDNYRFGRKFRWMRGARIL